METGVLIIVTGMGLAASAGLNAYIPLLIAAILTRIDVISLQPPYDVLGSWPAIAILVVLLAVEFIADKVPAVDSVNDIVQTIIRPASGALLFAGAVAPDSTWTGAAAVIAGLGTAAGVHAVKSTVRPVANVTTGGVAAPVLSILEDLAAIALSIAAILLPILAAVMLIGLIVAMVLLLRAAVHRRRRSGAAKATMGDALG